MFVYIGCEQRVLDNRVRRGRSEVDATESKSGSGAVRDVNFGLCYVFHEVRQQSASSAGNSGSGTWLLARGKVRK